jgi:hypothetical protein
MSAPSFVAATPQAAYVTVNAGGGLQPGVWRIASTGGAPELIRRATQPHEVAVDGSFAFFLDDADSVGVYRSPLDKPSGLGNAIKAPVSTGFVAVHGLVVDARCVYFWGSKTVNGATVGAIRISNKTREDHVVEDPGGVVIVPGR